MIRHVRVLTLIALLLAACAPATPLPASTQPATTVYPHLSPTQNPALVPFYTKNLPEAVLIAGNRQQTSRRGSSSWIVEKSGHQSVQEHGDAIGFRSSVEPLVVTPAETVMLRLPVPVKPASLEYWIIPAPESPSKVSSNGEWAIWENVGYQQATPLPKEVEQELDLPTAPGRYLLGVNAAWDDLGSVDYGFYLEVPSARETPVTLTPGVARDCASIERVANDSPEGQQILDEMIANFQRKQPTEYMGMAILQRIDRLGDWAVIQGSVSGEGKDVIAARRTGDGWQIVERYIITAPLASFDRPEIVVPDYFMEKLPEAPAALFTCLDQSWLLGRPTAGKPEAPASGQLAYLSHTEERMQLYTIHADGSKPEILISQPLLILNLAASLDGKQIAFEACPGSFSTDCRRGENFDIFTIDWEGGLMRRLTDDPAADRHPSWSPDGRIAFDSTRSGSPQIYVMDGDGSHPKALTDGPGQKTEPQWSPDGKWIAYHCTQELETRICVIAPDGEPAGEPIAGTTPVWSPPGPEGESRLAYLCFAPDKSIDICTARSDGSDLRNLTRSPADEHSPAWSPDGKWLAFVSNRGNDVDIYKLCIDCPEGTPAIRLTGEPRAAGWPAWSPDGRWLAYESGDSLMRVGAGRTGTTFLAGMVFSPPVWQPVR